MLTCTLKIHIKKININFFRKKVSGRLEENWTWLEKMDAEEERKEKEESGTSNVKFHR
jgi:hypothetical protein